MHTILITGGYYTNRLKPSEIEYIVRIYAAEAGKPLQCIRPEVQLATVRNYTQLWQQAKGIACAYFDNNQFEDGAYTQYLDHLIQL